jgi:hypothetical protein
MILSGVMLHMSFVGNLVGATDWNDDIVIACTAEAALYKVCAFHWPTPDPEPPDPGPWGSIPNQDEVISDHIHMVLHQAHFAANYVESEAKSLSSYLDICDWQMYSVPDPEDVFVAHVEPIQCHMSCSPQGRTDFTLLFGTGATHSFTNHIDDFVTDLQTETMSVVGFIGNDATVMGSGTVQWTVHGSNGKTTNIRTEAYYVPAGHRCLFCPPTPFHELGALP